MKIVISAAARADLIAGYHFYEAQQKSLGRYFRDSLYADIDSLQVWGGMHAVHFGKYHRMLAKTFPYAVYYEMRGDTAVVWAVIDCRRSPDLVSRRFE
jgi:plasmid stabilization system protein ParE